MIRLEKIFFMKKIIAVFTGNRAEYGLQYPVLKAIDAHPDLEYRLIVSGAHLDKNFGNLIVKSSSPFTQLGIFLNTGIECNISHV